MDIANGKTEKTGLDFYEAKTNGKTIRIEYLVGTCGMILALNRLEYEIRKAQPTECRGEE